MPFAARIFRRSADPSSEIDEHSTTICGFPDPESKRFGPDGSHHSGRDRRNLGRHLVGLDVEQRLVRLHGVADLLVPVGHRSFGHGLAELRHNHVHRSSPFYAVRLKARFTSATMRATVGTTASSSWSAEGSGT